MKMLLTSEGRRRVLVLGNCSEMIVFLNVIAINDPESRETSRSLTFQSFVEA